MNLTLQKFSQNTLKVTPRKEHGDGSLAQELLSLLDEVEQHQAKYLVLDLKLVQSFTPDFIVCLLEMTSRLRRSKGDLYVLNINYQTLEELLTFNPKAFLSVAKDEKEILSRLENDPQKSAKPSPRRTRNAVKKSNRIEIPYDEDAIYKACDVATKVAAEMGFPEKEISRIKVAVYEACLNALQHTRRSEAGETILVEVERDEMTLQINVYDHGRGFTVEKARDYDVTQAVSHRKTGGMGLHIIRKAMDEVDYRIDPLAGNRLIMVKYLPD